MALKWPIEMTKDQIFDSVQYETDCKRLVHAWNGNHFHDSSYFSGVIQDCALLINRRNFHSLCFVNRIENKALDCLVSLAFYVHEKYWIKDYPHQLQNIVSDNDVQTLEPFFFLNNSSSLLSKKRKLYP